MKLRKDIKYLQDLSYNWSVNGKFLSKFEHAFNLISCDLKMFHN